MFGNINKKDEKIIKILKSEGKLEDKSVRQTAIRMDYLTYCTNNIRYNAQIYLMENVNYADFNCF